MPDMTCESSRVRQEESLFFPGSLKDIDSVAAEVARDIRNHISPSHTILHELPLTVITPSKLRRSLKDTAS